MTELWLLCFKILASTLYLATIKQQTICQKVDAFKSSQGKQKGSNAPSHNTLSTSVLIMIFGRWLIYVVKWDYQPQSQLAQACPLVTVHIMFSRGPLPVKSAEMHLQWNHQQLHVQLLKKKQKSYLFLFFRACSSGVWPMLMLITWEQKFDTAAGILVWIAENGKQQQIAWHIAKNTYFPRTTFVSWFSEFNPLL